MLKIKKEMITLNNEIKDYIINNFKDDNEETIRSAVEESIKDNDEVALPGLGIFFLLNWEAATEKERSSIIKRIHDQIKKGN